MTLCRALPVLWLPVFGSVAGLFSTTLRVLLGAASVLLLLSDTILLAGDSCSTAFKNVCTAFKTTIGKGLALVAVAIAGLRFAFGDGGSKSASAVSADCWQGGMRLVTVVLGSDSSGGCE